MHGPFLNDVERDLDRDLANKGCTCACARPRSITSLAVVATINGQQYVYDAANETPGLTPVNGAALAAVVKEG